MSDELEVRPVSTFDLEKYLGLWYEIGRLPLKWEDESARNITAHYSLQDDGKIRVDNRCFDEDDTPTQSLGVAEPVEGEVGQLKVSFLPKLLRWIPFTEGDYWVLAIDPDYSVALVGSPNRENLWLLARDWNISADVVNDYQRIAQDQGFDLAQWIVPTHDGEVVTDDMLSE